MVLNCIALSRMSGGFGHSVYWEGSDEDGGGNGEWAIDTRGEACAGWVAYIAAIK